MELRVDFHLVGNLQFLAALVTAVVALFAVYMRNNALKPTLAPLAPGPRPYPILGNLAQLSNPPFKSFADLRNSYGDVFSIRFGALDVVVISGAKAIQEAFGHGEAFTGRPQLRAFQHFGKGLSIAFTSYSPTWKLHRKLVRQAIGESLKNLGPEVDDVVTANFRKMGHKWVTTGHALDPKSDIEAQTLRSLFWFCFGSQDSDESRMMIYANLLRRLHDTVPLAGLTDLFPWTRSFLWWSVDRVRAAADAFTDAIAVVIDKSLKNTASHVVGSLQNQWDRLTQQAAGVQGVTRQQVLHSAEDLIGAGLENSVNFVHWALFYMAKYPSVQDAMYREILDVLGHESTAAYAVRDRLPYSQAVMWEILRHSGTMPLTLPHSCPQGATFRGYHIPKEAVVFGNLASLANDEEVFPEPQNFDPSHVLSADGQAVDETKVSHLTMFGLGWRRCLGEQLGRRQMFLALVTLIQSCQFVEDPGHELRAGEGDFTVTFSCYRYKLRILARQEAAGIE